MRERIIPKPKNLGSIQVEFLGLKWFWAALEAGPHQKLGCLHLFSKSNGEPDRAELHLGVEPPRVGLELVLKWVGVGLVEELAQVPELDRIDIGHRSKPRSGTG
ncbi:hypothetical protein V6N13_057273 [Hibiscus sabdariffa]